MPTTLSGPKYGVFGWLQPMTSLPRARAPLQRTRVLPDREASVLAHRLQNPIAKHKDIREDGFARRCHAVRDAALRGDTAHNGAAVLDRHEPGPAVAGTEGSAGCIGRHKDLRGGIDRRDGTTEDGNLPLRHRRSVVPDVRCHSSHPARVTRKSWQPDRLENEVDGEWLRQLDQRNVVGLILAGCIVRVDEHTAVVRRPGIWVARARFCLHVAVRIGPGIGEFAKPDIGRHAMGSGQDPLRIDQHAPQPFIRTTQGYL